MKIRIGTRASHLARTQSSAVADWLADQGHETELVMITTSGDASNAPYFGSIGSQGVFVREIEQALINKKIDVAVHSYKDLPTSSTSELHVVAVPARADPTDTLLIRSEQADPDEGFLPIQKNATVGTASARRQIWVEHIRPDLNVTSLRGNVPTRIQKLRENRYDAILLASAGIERLQSSQLTDAPELNLADFTCVRLDPNVFVPAPAQGAIALQCRSDDAEIGRTLAPLDEPVTRGAVEAERRLLSHVEGGCELAFGSFCENKQNQNVMVAMIEKNGQILKKTAQGAEPSDLADELADLLVGA